MYGRVDRKRVTGTGNGSEVRDVQKDSRGIYEVEKSAGASSCTNCLSPLNRVMPIH